MLTPFDKLPLRMQNESVRAYYDIIAPKRRALLLKRMFDIFASGLLLLLLFLPMLVISCAIKFDSRGPVFYRQKRVTRDLRVFRIFKFRSMVTDADQRGPLVTVGRDARITRSGEWLRKTRLDELPQLINVLMGDMSFVGTRPEVEKYVDCYTDSMLATLLLPAGVTSDASIEFKDEACILESAADPDKAYVEEVLPAKMSYNLSYFEKFGPLYDIDLMIRTVGAVLK